MSYPTRNSRACPPHRSLVIGAALAGAAVTLTVAPLAAQTDFYNTDRNRPIQIEDAFPTERYAFELQLAPVRLERVDGGLYNWGFEPEITYGIFPRTHLEIGVPLAFVDGGPSGGTDFGLAGLDVSVLHNLNLETASLPAFALVADAVLPVGSLAPDKAYLSVRGIATRTFTWARFHLNGQYTFGSADGAGTAGNSVVELSRWLAGVAVDRTFPLRSTLVTAELYIQDPLAANSDLELNAGAGIRYQLSPQFALDGGLGRRLTGIDQSWFVTFGAAYAFAIRGLIPVPRR
ncbi:MAG: transporter [Gemmatimonadota bacterium]|nr:transporter [Gemmatimonadota bacterium]